MGYIKPALADIRSGKYNLTCLYLDPCWTMSRRRCTRLTR